MEVEILTLRKLTTSVFTFSKNGRKTLYLVAGYRQKYYVNAAYISTFFCLFTCLNGLFVHRESGFSPDNRIPYILGR